AVALSRTRLNGEQIVDTMNLVTQASAAMGDEAGNALKEIVTRGQLVGRLQINPQELFGTGVEFDDIAKQLATSMNVGIADARKEIVTVFGNELAAAFEKTAPIGKAFLQGLLIAALSTGIAFFKLRKAVRDAFGDPTALDGANAINAALLAGKIAFYAMAGGI